jgi:hypothetical protein
MMMSIIRLTSISHLLYDHTLLLRRRRRLSRKNCVGYENGLQLIYRVLPKHTAKFLKGLGNNFAAKTKTKKAKKLSRNYPVTGVRLE